MNNNPAELEIVGTIAPLRKDEKILSIPVGRQLTWDAPNIPTPTGTSNNGQRENGQVKIALAPAVVQRSGDRVSADFSGSFPEWYRSPGVNNKWDFGPVKLCIANDQHGAEIGRVPYEDTAAGTSRGWIFDFDISTNDEARQLFRDGSGKLKLVHATYGDVLAETDYFVVSNQQGIYGEQKGPWNVFMNQGTREPVEISVYRRGVKLDEKSCPPITVWEYASVPLQKPGDAMKIREGFGPGQKLDLDTSEPGNFLVTFTVEDQGHPQGDPPTSYSQFMNPPYITNWPQISLRLLPNDVDFRRYYRNPDSKEPPIGNDSLTFDVVFRHSLRTYYLLYPSMNSVFDLSNKADVAKNAKAILWASDEANWMQLGYMPRTRDLSQSRRTLLQAWCRKVLAEQVQKGGP